MRGYAYLEHIGCDETSFRCIDEYLKLIKARATGHQLTPATWMRNFVHSHRDYQQDSVVSESIAFDLVKLGGRSGNLYKNITCTWFTRDLVLVSFGSEAGVQRHRLGKESVPRAFGWCEDWSHHSPWAIRDAIVWRALGPRGPLLCHVTKQMSGFPQQVTNGHSDQ